MSKVLTNIALSLAFAGSVVGTQLASAPEALAYLPVNSGVKNAGALLRNALPINNKPIRDIQRNLEAISEELRIPGEMRMDRIRRYIRRCVDRISRRDSFALRGYRIRPPCLPPTPLHHG